MDYDDTYNYKTTTTLSSYDPKYETILKLEGKTDDLLNISDDGSMVMTRLFKLESDTDVEMEEVIDVSITSVHPNGEQPIFNTLRGKKLRIKVEVENEKYMYYNIGNDLTWPHEFYTNC